MKMMKSIFLDTGTHHKEDHVQSNLEILKIIGKQEHQNWLQD
jgi:hypothetical protein